MGTKLARFFFAPLLRRPVYSHSKSLSMWHHTAGGSETARKTPVICPRTKGRSSDQEPFRCRPKRHLYRFGPVRPCTMREFLQHTRPRYETTKAQLNILLAQVFASARTTLNRRAYEMRKIQERGAPLYMGAAALPNPPTHPERMRNL